MEKGRDGWGTPMMKGMAFSGSMKVGELEGGSCSTH